jgi:hypothetical protein
MTNTTDISNFSKVALLKELALSGLGLHNQEIVEAGQSAVVAALVEDGHAELQRTRLYTTFIERWEITEAGRVHLARWQELMA